MGWVVCMLTGRAVIQSRGPEDGGLCSLSITSTLSLSTKARCLVAWSPKMMAGASHMETPGLKTYQTGFKEWVGAHSQWTGCLQSAVQDCPVTQWDPSTAHCRVMFLWVRASYKPSTVSIHFPPPPQAACVKLSKSLALSSCIETHLHYCTFWLVFILSYREEFASILHLPAGMSMPMLPSVLSLSLVYLNCNVLGAGTLTLVWISITPM